MPGNSTPTQRPLVLELVGPAGAGKSSLLQALSQRDQTIRAGLTIPRYAHLPNVLLLVPTFFGLHRPCRGFFWKEMKRVLYLTTLNRLVEKEASRNFRAIVLDEGPVYMLSRLLVLGKNGITSRRFEEWWQESIRQWANALDVVVWLDAEDATLTHRIRIRNRPLPVANAPDNELIDFLARYRAAFRRVISELTARGGPRVTACVTDQMSIAQITDHVLYEMDGASGPCRR